jgi:hypothetical protein
MAIRPPKFLVSPLVLRMNSFVEDIQLPPELIWYIKGWLSSISLISADNMSFGQILPLNANLEQIVKHPGRMR